jgi:hypothetical protein
MGGQPPDDLRGEETGHIPRRGARIAAGQETRNDDRGLGVAPLAKG